MEYMGSHIAALLLRMFVMYYPQMIEAGMIYKAIPPLYSIKEGKKTRYFTEQIDIVRYTQKLFLNKYTISDISTNKALDSKEVTLLFMRNADYIYNIESMAHTYALETYLLELILFHYLSNNNSINVDKLSKEIKKIYRFMDVKTINKIPVVSGVIGKSNMAVLSDKFFDDCKSVLDIMRSNDKFHYNINGAVYSLYQLMRLYEGITPSGVQRYKGLGEMDKEELAESTLYPGSDRTLVRYTMEDAKETLEGIRRYESDSKKILSLISTVTRDDLLE